MCGGASITVIEAAIRIVRERRIFQNIHGGNPFAHYEFENRNIRRKKNGAGDTAEDQKPVHGREGTFYDKII